MSRGFTTALLAGLLALIPAGAGAAGEDPLVTDLAGDANGLGLPHIPGGQVRALLGDQLDQDPFGGGVSTGPASYAPADILSVDHATEYVAIPVGEDGIDYRATALRTTLRTAAQPASPAGRTAYTVYAYLVEEGGGVCRSSFNLTLDEGQGAGTYPLEWRQENQFDSFCTRQGGAYTDPAWTAEVSATGIAMRIPFDSIAGVDDYYLREGNGIAKTLGVTQSIAFVPQWDRTPFGAEWEIGSDMPADVPCTRGCPA